MDFMLKSRYAKPSFPFSGSLLFFIFLSKDLFSKIFASFFKAIFFKSKIFSISFEIVWFSAYLSCRGTSFFVMIVIVSVCRPPVNLFSTISQLSKGLSFSIFVIFLEVASTPIPSKYLVAYYCYRILRNA